MKNKTRNFIKRATALILVLALFAFIVVMFFGCARPEDLPQSTRAMITLPNGEVVEGEMSHCTHWSDGWMEIVVDGVSYEVDEINVVIIEK